MCESTPLGAPISRHVSSVILINSPRGTGELFTHQYSLSLQTMATQSALLYSLVVSNWWYWPLLVLAYSLFVSPPHLVPPLSHSHNRNISQNPHGINMNIVSYSLTLYFSSVIAQTGHRGECRYFPRLGATQNPWRWITEVDKGVAVGVATDEGWSQPDSAVSSHKSRQG